MILPWPIRRPLFLMACAGLALSACIPRDDSRTEETETPRPHPADQQGPDAPLAWKKVAQRNGWAFMKLRQEGVVNLVIFGGIADGIKEASGAAAVLGAGWDLLTLTPEPLDGEKPGARDEFFSYALEQPGYRRKILVVSGKDLGAVLRLHPDTLSGIVIVRPGDAGYPDPALRTLIEELPETLPVLLLFAPDENPSAYYTAALLRSQEKQMRMEPDILKQRLLEGRIVNFLHVIRYPSEFVESRTTFRKGCRILPDGAWVIAHVSGERADGYCPLLLRFGGDTYRAVAVLPEAGCDYGITPAPAIRCR
jgi:hypothetical protein